MASQYTYDEEGDTWPFFVLAILSFILIPVTLRWFYRVCSNDQGSSNKIAGSLNYTADNVKAENIKQLKEFKSKQRSAKIFNKTLLFLIVGWAIVFYIGLNYTKETDLKSVFDPYTILDVSVTASERDIKSRYRKLSLKFHPDKLPKDITDEVKEEMEAAFIKINLAYKSLTDEVTRNNFLKYGHPDGPQDITHGIALPKFLVEGKYSPLMILVYVLLIGVLLPYIVGSWWNNVKSHNKKGLHIETAGLFTRKLADRNPAKIVAPSDVLDWVLASEEIKTSFGDMTSEQIKDLVYKHLNRDFEYAKTNPKLEAKKLEIVAKLPNLIDGLIEIAVYFRYTDIVIAAANLQKSIAQAVKSTGKYQELLQLPFVDPAIVEKQPIKKLGKLFTLTENELKKTLGIEDATKLKTALDVAAHIPDLRVIKAGFKVPGEEVTPPASSSHLVLKFLVKSPRHKSLPQIPEEKLIEEETMEYLRDPLKSNEEQPLLPNSYAPYFPKELRNKWYGVLVLQKDGKLVEGSSLSIVEHLDLSNLELTTEQWKEGTVTIGTFKIPLSTPTPSTVGNFHFRVILKNNAYFGSDVDTPVVMKVEHPKQKKIEELKKLIDNTEEDSADSDSDSDISDPEEDSLAGALAALKGASVKKAAEDEEGSDISDNESVFTDINTDTEDEGEI